MTTTPTPAEFLAQTEPDEDDEPSVPADPLTSIADSLRQLVAAVERAESRYDTDTEDQAHDDYADLRAEYDEIEALHDAKQTLLDQVLEVCKPSTSRLADKIRGVLEPVVNPPAEPSEPPGEMNQPVPDADVEEWRNYARSQGYQGPDVDKANRSQIRTMLGISQPTTSGDG